MATIDCPIAGGMRVASRRGFRALEPQTVRATAIWVKLNLREDQVEKALIKHGNRWESFAGGVSSTRQKRHHPDFKQIIKLNRKRVIAFALQRLFHSSFEWHFVLLRVVKAPPNFSEAKGRIDIIMESWREWARRHGHNLS